MAIIHFSRREIEARIVFWGPALSGKTTSLRALHAFTPRGRRGQLETLDTVEERTIYFDYLPLMWGTIAGFQGRVKVLGVPGQPLYQQTRRALLRGADAVVFVADSGAQRLSANVESIGELQRALAELGRSMDELPVVLQYNKRDLPEALPVKVLQLGLNARDLPWFETVATAGSGVAEAFQALFELLSKRIERELASGGGEIVHGSGGAPPLPDEEEVRRTLGEIVAVRPAEEAQDRRSREVDSQAGGEGRGEGGVDAPVPRPAPPAEAVPAAPAEAEAGGDPPADAAEEEPPSTEEVVPPGFEDFVPEPPADSFPLEPSATLEPAAPPAPASTACAAAAVAEEPAAPSQREVPGPEGASSPEVRVTLPWLPRALQGCEVCSVAAPSREPDGTVIVPLTLQEPGSGGQHRVRLCLVPELGEPQSRPALPDPSENQRVAMVLLALASFLLGFGAAWVLFQT